MLLQLGFTSKAAHSMCNKVNLISMKASFYIQLASKSHDSVQPPLVGTHENPVENQGIKCKELNRGDLAATVKQTLLLSKSVPSLVPPSQSLDSPSFIDTANPDPSVTADPDKPNQDPKNHFIIVLKDYQNLVFLPQNPR